MRQRCRVGGSKLGWPFIAASGGEGILAARLRRRVGDLGVDFLVGVGGWSEAGSKVALLLCSAPLAC